MNTWKITIEKHRATWYYCTKNPMGGSFGSNYCGPKHVALEKAMRNIPEGAEYFINDTGPFVRRTLQAIAS